MAKLVAEGRRARRVDGGPVVIHEASTGGMRKLRCPGTHQLAVPTRTREGQEVFRTANGSTYRAKKF